QDLGNLNANTQIVTSGANTSAAGVHSDFDTSTLTCGSVPSSNDMIFKFHTVAGGATRLTVNNPTPGFPPVLALFDGSSGRTPQTQLFTNPTPTAVAGNGTLATAYNIPALGASPVAYSGDTTTLSDSQAANLYSTAVDYGGAPV